MTNDYIHTFSTMSSLKNSTKIYYSKTLRNNTSIIPVITRRFCWWESKSKYHPCLRKPSKKLMHSTLHEIKHLLVFLCISKTFVPGKFWDLFYKVSTIPGYYRTLFTKSSTEIQISSLDCILKETHKSNTCTKNTLTPLCFQMKKHRFLSFDINILLKATQAHYGFLNGDLVWQKLDNIDLRAKELTKFNLVSPYYLFTFKEIQLTESYTLQKKTQVYEFFPDWFQKWFDELTNHTGVTKTWSFYSISSFTTCLYAKTYPECIPLHG